MEQTDGRGGATYPLLFPLGAQALLVPLPDRAARQGQTPAAAAAGAAAAGTAASDDPALLSRLSGLYIARRLPSDRPRLQALLLDRAVPAEPLLGLLRSQQGLLREELAIACIGAGRRAPLTPPKRIERRLKTDTHCPPPPMLCSRAGSRIARDKEGVLTYECRLPLCCLLRLPLFGRGSRLPNVSCPSCYWSCRAEEAVAELAELPVAAAEDLLTRVAAGRRVVSKAALQAVWQRYLDRLLAQGRVGAVPPSPPAHLFFVSTRFIFAPSPHRPQK